MSANSVRKQRRDPRQSSEKRQARAYRHLALKAYFEGEETKADELLGMSNYWQARAMLNTDKDHAVEGAAIRVELY